jgi:Na+/proline symporter
MMLSIPDITVIVIYLLGITAVGVLLAGRIKSLAEFIMPRKFGKAMMVMHTFGTGTHSDQAVGVASKTFTNGLSGIWYQWLWLFATPFYWLIAPVMRRFRANTTADVFEARYDKSVAMLFALVGMLQLATNIGIMLRGSGEVISAVLGEWAPLWAVILVMTVLFVIYGIAGGLSAAIITDFVQGLLTIVFSFLLLPFILDAVGGLSGLHEKISEPRMFSLVAPAEIGVFYVVVIAFNALVGWVTQPHNMGMCAAGRTEMEGRIGTVGGSFVKRICTIAWCLTGLAALAYFAGQDLHPDQVYGKAAAEFLPRIMPGLLGVFMASLLASVMSSCDSFMIASSGLFTENIYRPLAPEKSERHYLVAARITSLIVVVAGVAYAFWLPDVVKGIEIFWKLAPMMGIAFWMGLFWRRATVAGAWASTLTAFFVWWLTSKGAVIAFISGLPGSEALRFTVQGASGPEIYLPWQMIFYLSAGLVTGIAVSLLTRPVSDDKLEDFYALARTPIKEGEEIREPCRIPDGVDPAPRDNLVSFAGLEIQKPSFVSVIGFAISWIIVALIIYAFVIISRG